MHHAVFMHEQRRPTIREIANACGCNNSTVSRALNNKTNISAATRERVRNIAEKMGWKPNPLASAYMAHRRSTQESAYCATLAYIAHQGRLEEFGPFDAVTLHFEGAKECAAKFGYTLEPFTLHGLPDNGKQLSQMLKSRGIPGVIIPDGEFPTPNTLTAFEWSHFACAISGHCMDLPMHRSAYHWPNGMHIAIEHIRNYGYQHTALILTEEFDELTHFGLTSTFYHYEKHHRQGEQFQSLQIPKGVTGKSKHIATWLRRHRPEVIISTKDTWQALEQMEWNIPEDIAFVSPHWSFPWPQVAGINQNFKRAGANAVELVAAQINANERGLTSSPRTIMNDGYWVDGPSLPRR